MIKIVVTADNHLNNFYAKMTPNQLEERRKHLRKSFEYTVDYALEREVDIYIQCGDLFDMPDPRMSELIEVARQFRRLHEAGISVLCIGGTHDVPKMRTAGASPLRIYHEVGHAHVFYKAVDPDPVTMNIQETSLTIGGLSTDPRLIRGDDPLEGVTFDSKGEIGIMLLHYGIEGCIHPDANEPILERASLALLSGVYLYFVGHVHPHSKFGVADKTVYVPGSTERMSFGELKIVPGFYYLEIEDKMHIKDKYIQVPCQPMREIVIHSTELSVEDPSESIFSRLQDVSDPNQLLKCKLCGPIDRDIFHRIRQREIFLEGSNHNFFFDLDARELTVTDGKEIIATGSGGISPKDEIKSAAQTLIENSGTSSDREIIIEARELAVSSYDGS